MIPASLISRVPDPANPQSLNRYAYVLNNPLRYTDPTGRCVAGLPCFDDAVECIGNAFNCVRDPIAAFGSGSADAFAQLWAAEAAAARAAASWTARGAAWTAQFLEDKAVDFGECVGAGLNCVRDPIARGASNTGEFVADNWGTISPAIQWADVAPFSVIPYAGPIVGVPLDLAAFAATQIDIIRSGCGPGAMLEATALNVANLAIGETSNVVGLILDVSVVGIPVQVAVSLGTVGVEAYLVYSTGRAISNCAQ